MGNEFLDDYLCILKKKIFYYPKFIQNLNKKLFCL